MIRFTQGNLLEAEVDAVVNTVNTVGVMGKGIALMFKERYPDNFEAYAEACKRKEVQVGEMFVTATSELSGPQWVINFPTKQHWRNPTKMEWVADGLESLKRVISEKGIRSVAIPSLGCGNGGLNWQDVRKLMERSLGEVKGVEFIVYEPTEKYQNVAKKTGVEKLTTARALIVEMVRRYEILGNACSMIEVQKLAWFLERTIERMKLENPLDLRFEANRYGPYANRLSHLLNSLDGSYLQSDKRIADSEYLNIKRFNYKKVDKVSAFLQTGDARAYLPAIEETDKLIDGFQSPLGMEALATVDWLIVKEGVSPNLLSIRQGISAWPAGREHARRKEKLFSDKLLETAIKRVA